MPIKYIPYYPEPIEGQALLNNFTRTRRALAYRDNDKPAQRILRGMPLYEMNTIETVGENPNNNLIIRGECLSACAYLKAQGITVDLVYIDPPFASGANYAKQIYLRRNPKVAKAIAAAETKLDDESLRAFEETMYGDIWNKEAYLNWMYENLLAIKSVMSANASIYVHLDWHIGHYIKVLMDEIFGESNFRNEIVVRRTKKNIRETEYVRSLNVATDSIYLYVTSDEVTMLPPSREFIKDERWHSFDAPNWSGTRPNLVYELFGKMPPSRRCWLKPREGADELINQGRLRPNPKTGKPEYLIDATDDLLCDTLWDDIAAYSFQNDYATEKNPDLLERVINSSSKTGMVVADFFGGSGVTSQVAYDTDRNFIHVDVGINSIQTTRDRLKSAGASFHVLAVQDGVALFRNPTQTMEKLAALIPGLGKSAELNHFWAGGIQDSKDGLIPVYLPNLLDHREKLLDRVSLNRIVNEQIPLLPENVKRVRLYYVDMEDENEIGAFLKEYGSPLVMVELYDLKNILHEIVLSDEVAYTLTVQPAREIGAVDDWLLTIMRFHSDYLEQKIAAHNQKLQMNGSKKKARQKALVEAVEETESDDGSTFTRIEISEGGLELIELVSLDCTAIDGTWHSNAEVKIDKKGYAIRNGVKSKAFWDATITSSKRPLRLKVRNIAGDETVIQID
jgi:adenine-specific DNA-methyltransferase